MKSPDREMVTFPERERCVVNEGDLEINFPLVKEATLACFENALKHATNINHKEIPVLADFEACA